MKESEKRETAARKFIRAGNQEKEICKYTYMIDTNWKHKHLETQIKG